MESVATMFNVLPNGLAGPEGLAPGIRGPEVVGVLSGEGQGFSWLCIEFGLAEAPITRLLAATASGVMAAGVSSTMETEILSILCSLLPYVQAISYIHPTHEQGFDFSVPNCISS